MLNTVRAIHIAFLETPRSTLNETSILTSLAKEPSPHCHQFPSLIYCFDLFGKKLQDF
jgi:hypothetical protein